MDPARPTTVAPGRFEFAVNSNQSSVTTGNSPLTTYRVVWWDPSLLHLNAASAFGLRRDDLIVKDGDMFAVEERLADYERWRMELEQLVEQGSVPSLRVQTATSWAAEAAALGIDDAIAAASGIEIVHMPGAEGRPRGPRFGTLVHAVLAIVPLDADDEIIRRTADVQARIINSPAEEVVAASHAVRAVLKHELMARARSSPRVRRETPITWTQKDGTLIEGVLDLAFDEPDLTTVIDFKTDHELSAGEARYRAQLQKYVDAVAAATERRVAGVLFKV
jgi:ATP-dependent exoDNAse (exonuclease V) beta subunit